MTTRLDLLRKFNQATDRDEMYRIIEQALDLVTYAEASKAFAEGRVKKLEEQVKRQVDIITNLEAALKTSR